MGTPLVPFDPLVLLVLRHDPRRPIVDQSLEGRAPCGAGGAIPSAARRWPGHSRRGSALAQASPARPGAGSGTSSAVWRRRGCFQRRQARVEFPPRGVSPLSAIAAG